MEYSLFASPSEDGPKNDSNSKGCKMLWFTAMYESTIFFQEESKEHNHATDYSVALKSALLNAPETLQPVLILGQYDLDNENSTEHNKLGRWAEDQGVKVIYSSRLTFQKDVVRNSRYGENQKNMQQGPLLRLDIPTFVKDNALMDIPNVCQDHVLYTDVDVVFANRIMQGNVQLLSNSVGQKGMVSYGQESRKEAEIVNTGVMVIHVENFAKELSSIHQFARDQNPYPCHDQEMLNLYMLKEYADAKEKIQLLPIQYNWKLYWGLEPTDFSQAKIVHFHGPKLGIGLEEVAQCIVPALSKLPDHIKGPYRYLIHQGICCDHGRTAKWSLETINSLRATSDDLCDSKE